MKRVLLTLGLLVVTAPLRAQLKLFTVDEKGLETAVTAPVDLGNVAVGQAFDTQFRVRNTGPSAIPLTELIVPGTRGFNVPNQVNVPFTLAPGTNADFVLRFQPDQVAPYSAQFPVYGIPLTVFANATASTQLYLLDASKTLIPLGAGSTIDCGRAQLASSSSITLVIKNSTNVSLPVPARQIVSGSSFGLTSPQPAPASLASQQSFEFQIVFTPASTGIAQGLLQVGPLTYRLAATGIDAPLPQPTINVTTAQLQSGQQSTVSISLASPPTAPASGRLLLQFKPLTVGADDVAIQFLANGSRAIPFTVVPGDPMVRFGSATSTPFQTGTSAGKLTFSAQVGGWSPETSLTITASPVVLDSTQASRTSGAIAVNLSGYDNSHAASTLTFTFYSKTGGVVGLPIVADVTSPFQDYFTASSMGGLFSLTAQFPVSGDASGITAVDVVVKNPAGTATASRIAISP